MPSSVRRWFGAATIAVVMGVATTANTNGQGTDIIYACFKAQSGQVRFVSAASECLSSETLIALNQTGVQGPQGAEGPPGPADLLPAVGVFTPMQLVQGAILTCTSTSTTETTATCLGLKLNGMDVRDGPGPANRICDTVTGAAALSGTGQFVAAQPYFTWTGTAWTLLEVDGSPVVMGNLICFR